MASVLFQNDAKQDQISEIINELSLIDWEKKADMWRGNIVTDGSRGLKISTSNSAIKKAFEKVATKIGLYEKVEKNKGLFSP